MRLRKSLPQIGQESARCKLHTMQYQKWLETLYAVETVEPKLT